MLISAIPITDALVIRAALSREMTIPCAMLLLADIALNLGATLQGNRPYVRTGDREVSPVLSAPGRRRKPQQPHPLAAWRLTRVFPVRGNNFE